MENCFFYCEGGIFFAFGFNLILSHAGRKIINYSRTYIVFTRARSTCVINQLSCINRHTYILYTHVCIFSVVLCEARTMSLDQKMYPIFFHKLKSYHGFKMINFFAPFYLTKKMNICHIYFEK